jgi:hypothetical protein
LPALSLLGLEALASLLLNGFPVDHHWIAFGVEEKRHLAFGLVEDFLEALEILLTNDVNEVTLLVNILKSEILGDVLESAAGLGDDLSQIQTVQGSSENPLLFFVVEF